MSNIFHGSNGTYELHNLVGEGSFGVVRRGILTSTNEEVAIKQIVKVSDDRRMMRRVLRELRVLHTFRHKNIIHLIDVTYEQGAIYLLTELSRIDLFQLIHYNRAMYKTLTADDFKFVMKQMLDALEFLHFNGILHRDIKPSNVLINEKMHVHLCDFGLCRKLSSVSSTTTRTAETLQTTALHPPMTEYVVTRWYRAPEVCMSDGYYDVSQDIWSAACTFIELVTRKPLFPGKSTTQQIQLIVQTFGIPSSADLKFPMQRRAREFIHHLDRPRKLRPLSDIITESPIMPHDARQSFIFMLTGMMQFNPRLRMTASECLASHFFAVSLASIQANSDLAIAKAAAMFSLKNVAHSCMERIAGVTSHASDDIRRDWCANGSMACISATPAGGQDTPPPPPPPQFNDITFDDIECSTSDRKVLTSVLLKEVHDVQRDMRAAEERALASRVTNFSMDVEENDSATSEGAVVHYSNRALTEGFLYTQYARYSTVQPSEGRSKGTNGSSILTPSGQPTDACSNQVTRAAYTPIEVARTSSENQIVVHSGGSLPILQRCRAAANVIKRKSFTAIGFPSLHLHKESNAPSSQKQNFDAVSRDLVDGQSILNLYQVSSSSPSKDERCPATQGNSVVGTERDQLAGSFFSSFGSTGSSLTDECTTGIIISNPAADHQECSQSAEHESPVEMVNKAASKEARQTETSPRRSLRRFLGLNI